MKVYIIGISCVGKTTIGAMLAEYLGCSFYDLDLEVEKFYNQPLELIQNECPTMNEYRQKASVVLEKLFCEAHDSVIAGTPSGLMDSYLEIYLASKKTADVRSIHIFDKPENIIERLEFYDVNSVLLENNLTEIEKKRYLKEIILDYKYFSKSLNTADLQINIENYSLPQIPEMIARKLINSSDLSSADPNKKK